MDAELSDEKIDEDARRRWRKARRRRHRLGFLGLGLVAFILLFSLVGPFFIPYDPNLQDIVIGPQPPWTTIDGRFHLLGTDPLGRDILARLAAGGRASLAVVAVSLLIGGGIGLTLGVIAGYKGGSVDNVIMRLTDAQLALPATIFAMIVAAVLGVGFVNTAIALGFATWPIYARILRAEVLRVRHREHILVASTLGISTFRIIRVHILPNVISAVAIVGTLELGRMILIESTLSFVGLGMQPPDASWGSMIRQGQDYVFNAWWIATIPGFAIVIAVLGLNLLGDWIRDVLDPRTR